MLRGWTGPRQATYAGCLVLAMACVQILSERPSTGVQLSCPDGYLVVLDEEQVCFPNVSGTVPPEDEPLALGSPRGDGGTEEWCIRHDDRDTDPITNPWRVYCHAGAWWFHTGWDCYVRAAKDGAQRNPEWPRRDVGPDEEGRIFEIRCYPPQANQDGMMYMDGFGFWQASQFIIGPEDPPGFGGTPSVIPTLWVAAVNALAMRGPEIRTAPPVDSAALVNLPVWMWTEVGGRVWPEVGTLHEFAAAAGQRVDAYAEPLRIEWDMGDGSSPVICHGSGTAWERGLNLLEPGECHHVYRRASRHQPEGRYEMVAVTTWLVSWEIDGTFDGELEVEVGSTSPFQVEEVQVVTGRGR